MDVSNDDDSVGDTYNSTFSNWSQLFSKALTMLALQPHPTENPSAFRRQRSATGNEQRPPPLSGIDCVYESREMRAI